MLKLQDLQASVRNDMMIDKNGRIWNDTTVKNAINSAISKLISDVNHIQVYFEIELVEPQQETLELFDIHKNCIVTYASYLLFSQPSDSRNVEKAQYKKLRYEEELRTLFQKLVRF